MDKGQRVIACLLAGFVILLALDLATSESLAKARDVEAASGRVTSAAPAMGGACCVPTGECLDVTPEQCMDAGGVFFNGQPCTICDGACCVLPEECIDVNQGACEKQGGFFQGFNTDCPPVDCSRNWCCLPDLTCDFLTEQACAASNGVFLADEVSCPAYDCTRGACCRPEGFCEETPEAHCLDTLGGIWIGAGSTCADFNQNGRADVCEDLGQCRSDIVSDGAVNILDLITLLQDWGPCD